MQIWHAGTGDSHLKQINEGKAELLDAYAEQPQTLNQKGERNLATSPPSASWQHIDL